MGKLVGVVSSIQEDLLTDSLMGEPNMIEADGIVLFKGL